jgi:hypothetical protein
MNLMYSVTLETSDPEIVADWINRMHMADRVVSIQFVEPVASFVVFYIGEFNPYNSLRSS